MVKRHIRKKKITALLTKMGSSFSFIKLVKIMLFFLALAG